MKTVKRMRRAGGAPAIMLAASGGGHIDLLVALSDVVPQHARGWLTVEGARAKMLRAQGEQVWTVSPTDRKDLDFRNPLQSVKLAFATRPRLVITSGAGVMVTFALTARLLGASLIFCETMARVSQPSIAARILTRLAKRSIVQWPELRHRIAHSEVCRPTLLPALGGLRRDGEGTFVSLGTHTQPFSRLLEAVDRAVADGLLPGPVTVQAGYTIFSSPRLHCTQWMSGQELTDAIMRSRYVVGHCGAGLIGTALRLGRRPLVLPRLAEHGEHVDSHQEQLYTKFASLNLVVPIPEAGIGPSELERADAPWPDSDPFSGLPDAREILHREVTDTLGVQ